MNVQEKKPKVSVCVVTYNQEKYIRQCLQSIVDQEANFNFEIIVGVDCSTDNTKIIVQEFANKYPEIIKPIYHNKNIGPYKNYLSVHSMATGEYIAHVDGDDWCAENKIAIQSAFLDQNSNYSAAVHILEKWNRKNNSIIGYWPNKFKYKNYNLEKLVTTHCEFGHSSLMYRKNAFDPNEFSEIKEFIDFHIYVHLASKGDIGAIEKVLGSYSTGIGISTSKNLYKLVIQSLVYAKKLGLPNHIFKYQIAKHYYMYSKKALSDDDKDLFRNLISSSIKEQAISIQQYMLFAARYHYKFLRLALSAFRTFKVIKKKFTPIDKI